MSLRKSTCLTPQRLDAARRNSQRSTGPRSEAGKERMKMNAVKHGCDAAPENDAAVMRALGEDPEHYAALKRELATAYGPGDALWDRQTEDLARLYWRRNRLERMETGLMRDALEEVEEERRSLARDLADVTFEPSQCEAVALDLPKPTHPLVRLRMLVSLWGVIREQVRRRVFGGAQRYQIENYYKGELGWRPRQIGHLLLLFANWAYRRGEQDQAELDKYVKENFGGEAQVEARYQELVRLLEEQIAAVEAAFAEEMKAQERKDAIARDSCLAPEDETANMVLRLEMSLDRAIDRKVRILLTMRKEHGNRRRRGPVLLPMNRQGLAQTRGSVSAIRGRMVKLDLPFGKRRPPTAGVCASRATENPAEENGGETSKSPEQSENVTENKGPAAEEVAA